MSTWFYAFLAVKLMVCLLLFRLQQRLKGAEPHAQIAINPDAMRLFEPSC